MKRVQGLSVSLNHSFHAKDQLELFIIMRVYDFKSMIISKNDYSVDDKFTSGNRQIILNQNVTLNMIANWI